MKRLVELILSIWRHPLNARPFSAISRMLRWQIATRILPESLHALPFVNGSLLLAKRGDVGVTGNWYNGLDEPCEMGFLLHTLRSGDLFVDVGANVGSFTVLACSIDGVSAIAFEPIPETAIKLRRNILINDFGTRVEVRMTGVSNTKCTLRFTKNQDSMNHVVGKDDSEPASSIEVEVVRLDDELSYLPPGQLLVFKIDVEGHEYSVIEGARNILSKDTTIAVIMEINGSGMRYGISDECLIDEMKSLGFIACIYDIKMRELSEIQRVLPSHQNTIFIKDIEFLRQRIKIAPSLQINSFPL